MTAIVAYLTAHPAVGAIAPLVGYLALSAALNAALAAHTAEEWVALEERGPRRAAVIRALRAAGLDPAGLLRAVQAFAAARAKSSADSAKKGGFLP